jgi:hypothetical protein
MTVTDGLFGHETRSSESYDKAELINFALKGEKEKIVYVVGFAIFFFPLRNPVSLLPLPLHMLSATKVFSASQNICLQFDIHIR